MSLCQTTNVETVACPHCLRLERDALIRERDEALECADRQTRDAIGAIEHAQRVTRERDRLRALLREVEQYEQEYCVICGGEVCHEPDCRLKAALEGT